MNGFFLKLILPLVVAVLAICGLLARNNAEQWHVLFDQAGSLYDERDYEEALEMATRSLERAEGWLGLTATYKSDSLNLMALSLDELERYEESEAAYRRALQVEEKGWGKEGNLDYAAVLDNFAASLDGQGRYEEAITLAQEALSIWEPAGSRQRVYSLNTLASAFNALDDYEQAVVYTQMVVQVLETEWPQDERRLVNALHWEGDLYYILDRYEEAEVALLRSLELAQRVALAEVVDLVSCTSDALLAQGKVTAAEALYGRVIAFHEQASGRDSVVMEEDGSIDWNHPDAQLSRLLSNFGNMYMAINAHAKAAEQFQRVSELDARLYGADHFYVVTDLNDLGVAFDLASNYELAAEAYLRALAILDKWEEPDNDRVFFVLQNLFETYENAGHLDRLPALRERMHALMPEETVQPLAVGSGGAAAKPATEIAAPVEPTSASPASAVPVAVPVLPSVPVAVPVSPAVPVVAPASPAADPVVPSVQETEESSPDAGTGKNVTQ